MKQPDANGGSKVLAGATPAPQFFAMVSAALLSAVVVIAGALIYLSRGLPDGPGETLHYPAIDFSFAFGSGSHEEGLLNVNEFTNGYALLTSGLVSIQASEKHALKYTWLPSKIPSEAAFYWRKADDLQNVVRTEITEPGTQLINLSSEPEWQGEITEIGFLVAGNNGGSVKIGEASLLPDTLTVRLQLTWRAWTSFEGWGQQSINFLYGGDYRQVLSLPLLVAAWLGFTLLFLWVLQRFGTRIDTSQLISTAGVLFLLAWILLDIRWSANNLRQIQLSLDTNWQTDEQQRLSSDLDGEIYQYVQRLKSSVLGNQNARILIIGDETANDYYLLRAKYHLLPHNVHVAGRFAKEMAPESVDFIIAFGQAAGITKVQGWKSSWQQLLVPIDQGEWGVVYRVK